MRQLLYVLIASLGLMSYAQAEPALDPEGNTQALHHKNFIGQRPYAKAPVAKQDADEKWVGAGIVTDKPEKSFDKHQQMRLNFIGKRPYTAATSPD